MKIVTIIPARETSARLPGKHLKTLLGTMTLLEVMTKRLRSLPGDKVIACPKGSKKLEAEAARLGWTYFAPDLPEADVAHRVMQAAAGHDVAVLAQGDSPCISTDLALSGLAWIEKGADFWGNAGPSGLRLKIFKPLFLFEAQNWNEPEHVLSGFAVPRGSSAVMTCLSDTDLKLSIDTKEDLSFLRDIFGKVGLHAPTEEILEEARFADNKRRRSDGRTQQSAGDARLDSFPRSIARGRSGGRGRRPPGTMGQGAS